MRYSFVVSNYAPAVGGAQVLVQRVAEGLVARHGHDVEVVTTDALLGPASSDPRRIPTRCEPIGGVTVRRLPLAQRARSSVRLLRRALGPTGLDRAEPVMALAHGPLGARWAREVGRSARRSDAVVGVASPYLTLAAVDRATRGTTAAHVALPLLHLSAAAAVPEWVTRSLRRADGCVALTSVERERFEAGGVAGDRIAILPPGCDPDRYEDLTPSEARRQSGLPDRPTLGFVGRLAAHKGIDTLLDAAPRLWAEHPDLTILIAGGRTGWTELDRLLDGLDPVADGRLIVREGFEESDRPRLLAACDVVAFPSREESFGMVTIEAWCARRAVVAGDIAAVRCLVTPGVDGELVPVGDDRRLADEVSSLLRDPERRARYGAAGRARAEAEFSWDTVVDGWDELLRASVDRRLARAGR